MKYSPLEMHFSDKIDTFHWGLVSDQYANFRPAPPQSFLDKLESFDVGKCGQYVLDLGTGVGHLARKLAKKGCIVTGIDISNEQISYAKKLALQEHLYINLNNIAVEEMQYPENYFDVAIAMQSWAYFNTDLLYPKLQKTLKPGSLITIGNFDHLPRLDIIARETEKLMLQYNPEWCGADFDGYVPPFPSSLEKDFILKAMFFYDEPIPFTRESWLGRIIASQAIGVSLTNEWITEFSKDMRIMLGKKADNKFTVMHRLSAHVMQFK